MARVTKRTIINEYKDAINKYSEEIMPKLQKMYEDKLINYGQYSLRSLYDSNSYHWLYGGKPWWAEKKEPCRLYGWAYEETTLWSFRYNLENFKEFKTNTEDFINRIEVAQAGEGKVEDYIQYLPEELEDKMSIIKPLTWEIVIHAAKGTMEELYPLMEPLNKDDLNRQGMEKVYNRCYTFLKNYTKEVAVNDR